MLLDYVGNQVTYTHIYICTWDTRIQDQRINFGHKDIWITVSLDSWIPIILLLQGSI